MANFPYATSAQLLSCTISNAKGENTLDITDLVQRFDYFEDINQPMTHAKLQLADSGSNIISSYPIQGFEKIVLSFKATDDQDYEYEMRVNKIQNRFEGQRFQTYTLGLISLEALVNESIKLAQTIAGKPEELVSQMLEKLSSEKEFFYDRSLFKVKFNIAKKSPFSVIDFVKSRAVYGQSTSEATTSSRTTSAPATGTSDLGRTSASTYSKVQGTAGYAFYENRTGYHFKSLETLFSVDENEPVQSFYLAPAGSSVEEINRIFDIEFPQEIDILSKLRMGAFSSVLCTYDFSTGKYEESTYSLADAYDQLTHLGSQSVLPSGQRELSQYPTRVMSVLTDHETWNDEATIGSPDASDGGSGTSQYPDFQKHYIMQTIARSHTAINQKLILTIPGTPALKVGDTINVFIPNQVPSQNRSADNEYDPEHSGTYLISEVNHAFAPKKKQAATFLTVIRDTYGVQDTPSNVQ